jgi:glycosyltransferase involved in cell wall biosynthesis
MKDLTERSLSAVYLKGPDDEEPNPHEVHDSWLKQFDPEISVYKTTKLAGILRNSFFEELKGQWIRIDDEADLYVVENPKPLFKLKELKKENPDAKIIHLETSWMLPMLKPHNLKKEEVNNVLRAGNEILSSVIARRNVKKYVDGIITISKLMEARMNSYFPKKPVKTVKPFSLNKITSEPDFTKNNVVFVGAGRDHKGIDILVDAWGEVRREYPESKLFLVGENIEQKFGAAEGVHVKGYVENLDQIYSNCSLYVHPARFEAYGVSVLEAIKAGFPAIVTESTGAKEDIAMIDDSLICGTDSDDLAETIIEFFDLDFQQKREISEEFKREFEDFGERENSVRKFRETVSDILEEIDRN